MTLPDESPLSRLDARLSRASDVILARLRPGEPAPRRLVEGLLAFEASSLLLLAYAVTTLGGWVPVALAGVIVVARGPGLQQSLAALRRSPSRLSHARTCRAEDAPLRQGALGLLAVFGGIAVAATVLGALAETLATGGAEATAFGIDPESLTAWKVAALPLSTAAEVVRRYAECALPGARTSVSAGRSRPAGAA